ncbi:MAG: hypothetical protein ABSB09_01680 [Acidimicrobiales bacterium]|jgi:hypothetical protein
MDIEQFYRADERRRQSAEVEFGNNWFDAKGSRYELSWVEDTGELYAMLELVPEADSWTPFGDVSVEEVKVGSLLVTVLGTFATREEIEQLLDGWADHMAQPDGVHWVAERLQAAGVRRPELD